jgi:hypothetical protein
MIAGPPQPLASYDGQGREGSLLGEKIRKKLFILCMFWKKQYRELMRMQ